MIILVDIFNTASLMSGALLCDSVFNFSCIHCAFVVCFGFACVCHIVSSQIRRLEEELSAATTSLRSYEINESEVMSVQEFSKACLFVSCLALPNVYMYIIFSSCACALNFYIMLYLVLVCPHTVYFEGNTTPNRIFNLSLDPCCIL